MTLVVEYIEDPRWARFASILCLAPMGLAIFIASSRLVARTFIPVSLVMV